MRVSTRLARLLSSTAMLLGDKGSAFMKNNMRNVRQRRQFGGYEKYCRCQMPDTSSSAVTLFIGNVRKSMEMTPMHSIVGYSFPTIDIGSCRRLLAGRQVGSLISSYTFMPTSDSITSR